MHQLLAPCREDELALVRAMAQLFIKNSGEARVNKAQFDAEVDEARRQHTDGQCQDARTAIREVAQDCGLSDSAPETPLDETAALMSCLTGDEWSLVRKLSQQLILSRGETLPEIL